MISIRAKSMVHGRRDHWTANFVLIFALIHLVAFALSVLAK